MKLKPFKYLRKPEPYLKKTEPRGKILFARIRPHLWEGDKFLDSGCGYSPMAAHILEANHKITGFDIYPEAIDYLKQKIPSGDWHCTPYEKAHFKGYTVLLLLGASDAWNMEDFYDYVIRTITQNQIRLIFLELAKGRTDIPEGDNMLIMQTNSPEIPQRVKGYNHALNILLKRGYRRLDSGHYDSGIGGAPSSRIYAILSRARGL